MRFIRFVTILLGGVLAAEGFQHTREQTIERAAKLAGSTVQLRRTDGEVLTGRLTEVDGDHLVIEPRNPGQGASRTLAMTDIRTIRSLGFRASQTAKVLRISGRVVAGVPYAVVAAPFFALILCGQSIEWLKTGKWPPYTP